jgi:hypothetical protein
MPLTGNFISPHKIGVTGGGDAPVNLDFVSTWDTTKAGSASNTVVLPLLSGGTYSGTIDWGDTSTSVLSYANRSHTYASGGVYTITISGTISGFRFANGGDKLKIGNVSNWGNLTITTDQAFFGCTNLTATATDAPIISTATLSYTFYGCSNFNGYVNGWDVSGVSNAERIFMLATSFNQDLDNWDTSGFTNISNMFTGAILFNGNLSGWTLSSVTIATAFLQGTAFNNNSIDNWEVKTIQLFNSFFRETSFNQDISGWDMSAATRVDQMFFGNTAFNQNIGGWVLSNCTRMDYMLFNNDSFDQDISGWDINQVSNFLSFMQSATGLSTANYDALLIAWDAQGAMSYSGTVNFGGSKYTSGGAAEAARTSLISKWGGITDGGPA